MDQFKKTELWPEHKFLPKIPELLTKVFTARNKDRPAHQVSQMPQSKHISFNVMETFKCSSFIFFSRRMNQDHNLRLLHIVQL